MAGCLVCAGKSLSGSGESGDGSGDGSDYVGHVESPY